MDTETKAPQLLPEERSFLQRYAPVVAIVAVLTIVIASVIGTIIVVRREAAKITPSIIAQENLPGPNRLLSERSKYQIDTMSAEYPHIVGTLVLRFKYSKTENMFIHSYAQTPEVKRVLDKIINDLNVRQNATTGMTSEETERKNALNPEWAKRQRLRNSDEAKMGLIKCIPIDQAALTYAELRKIATGICFATIPPFESNSVMAIVVLTDSKFTEFSELAEMRRILLALQIDIYNRDFQGRETWAHP